MYQFQDLGAISVDYENRKIYLNGEYATGDFRDCIDFSGKAHLMLSGGCDSQAMSSWLMHIGTPQTAYTYVALWDDEVINATDVVQAQRFAREHDLDHKLIDFDLREFYESNEYIEVAKRYDCASPQVAVHFRFMEMLETDNIVTGGEAPMLGGSSASATGRCGFSVDLFINYHRLYVGFGEKNGIEMHRNWFWRTPQLLWGAVRHNIDVLLNGYEYVPATPRIDDTLYKNHLYQAQGFNIMPLNVKYSGFENLKKILASQTGNYDEFNDRYRAPLKKIIPGPTWKNCKIEVSSDYRELVDEYVRLRQKATGVTNLAQWFYDF